MGRCYKKVSACCFLVIIPIIAYCKDYVNNKEIKDRGKNIIFHIKIDSVTCNMLNVAPHPKIRFLNI